MDWSNVLEFAWHWLPYVLAVVVGVGFLFVLAVFAALGIAGYRDSLGHRNGIHPTWGPRRFILLALAAITVAAFGAAMLDSSNIAITIAVCAAGGTLLVSLPTILNTLVVAWRELVAGRNRAHRRLQNPMFDWYQEWRQKREPFPGSGKISKFCWVIPTQEMLNLIAGCGDVVDVGAGTGYVPWLLRQIGVDVIAYDAMPGPTIGNRHHFFKFGWVHVRKADAARAAARHSDRALLLCWPPADNDMSSRALQAYQENGGTTVIYIGAKDTLCGADTGDTRFHTMLEQDWVLEHQLKQPAWMKGYEDYARVYRRKP
jgi:hypothetical protein